jgi:hypothetical protein
MINKPKTVLSFLATALITFAFCGQGAQAVPIGGTIEFVGFGGSTTTNGNTTTIDFSDAMWTASGTGDYSNTAGIQTTFKSINYTGTGANALLAGPVSPLWTFKLGATTYSFELTGVSFAYNGSAISTLAGSGIASITGYDPTPGSFVFGSVFQFVSGAATSVPDGGSTIALLGLALVGVEGLRRRLRSAFGNVSKV